MLLALDTATTAVTVAVLDGDDVLAEQAVLDSRRHTEVLVPTMQAVLAAARVRPGDITEVVVGVGPGPFTGLRVGVMTALTFAHVRELPVRGFCSLDAIAFEVAESAVISGQFAVASDARRKEVYWARYESTDSGLHRVVGPMVQKPGNLGGALAALPTAGRGPLAYPDTFVEPLPVLDVSAGWLGRLARSGAVSDLPVQPLYLRAPDAVPAAERAR